MGGPDVAAVRADVSFMLTKRSLIESDGFGVKTLRQVE